MITVYNENKMSINEKKNNFYNLAKKALDSYDIYREQNMEFQNKIDRYIIKINNDGNDIITIYDKNDKIIYKGKFQLMVTVNKLHAYLEWSWFMLTNKTNIIKYSKNLLLYGLNLSDEDLYLRMFLTSGIITDFGKTLFEEDTYVSIIYYLIKKKNFYYLKLKNEDYGVEFEFIDYVYLIDEINI
jgi:hypothetical protein